MFVTLLSIMVLELLSLNVMQLMQDNKTKLANMLLNVGLFMFPISVHCNFIVGPLGNLFLPGFLALPYLQAAVLGVGNSGYHLTLDPSYRR